MPICPLEQKDSVQKEDGGEMDTAGQQHSHLLSRVSVLKEPAFGGHMDLDLFSEV